MNAILMVLSHHFRFIRRHSKVIFEGLPNSQRTSRRLGFLINNSSGACLPSWSGRFSRNSIRYPNAPMLSTRSSTLPSRGWRLFFTGSIFCSARTAEKYRGRFETHLCPGRFAGRERVTREETGFASPCLRGRSGQFYRERSHNGHGDQFLRNLIEPSMFERLRRKPAIRRFGSRRR